MVLLGSYQRGVVAAPLRPFGLLITPLSRGHYGLFALLKSCGGEGGGVEGGLYLPCLHHSDHALGHAVGAFGVIFLGEAGAEECGERLVEAESKG